MKIKLFYPPLYYPQTEENITKMFYRSGPAKIPLLSLPILKSYLCKNGFYVEQDDLDIKTYAENNSREENKIHMSLFDNPERIKKFLDTGKDSELEEEAEKILNKTRYKGFDLFGFSITNEWNIAGFGSTLVLAKLLKEKTGTIIAAGGSDLGQMFNLFKMKNVLKLIDLIFLEPNLHAQYDFLVVLKKIEKGELGNDKRYNKRRHSFTDSYGRSKCIVVYNKGIINLGEYDEAKLTEQDIFPTPDFEGLPLELYKYSPKNTEKDKLLKSKILVLPYYFSYGCPNSCIFCTCSAARHFRFKNPESISEDLEELSSKNKTRFFVFYNTSVNPKKDFVRQFIKVLKEKDLDLFWSDCATIRCMDKKILKGLYDCGARRLIYGIETPSPRMLKYVSKGITAGKIQEVLKLSHDIGIWNEVELICGLPHESDEDIQKTLRFIEQNREYINYYNIHQFKLTRSRLSMSPYRYRIKNIKERTDKSVPGKAFDEINGLKWEDKLKQIKRSYETVSNKVSTVPNYGYSDNDECFLKLIYLYSCLGSKKEVLEYIKQNPFT